MQKNPQKTASPIKKVNKRLQIFIKYLICTIRLKDARLHDSGGKYKLNYNAVYPAEWLELKEH
jgi:hypothetical protein